MYLEPSFDKLKIKHLTAFHLRDVFDRFFSRKNKPSYENIRANFEPVYKKI